MPEFEILLYYWFATIDDPQALAEAQLELCRRLDLRGRIIVATEGINGTVSGTSENCRAYREAMHADPRFAEMVFKVDPFDRHAFRRLSVKARKEIVTLHAELDVPVQERTGARLSPEEFRDALDNPDAVVIDGRNDYEYDIGHFEGAIRPPIEVFKDTPEWLESLGLKKDQPILTYCTGGIRCEKLTALMLQEGFENVAQLDGGVVAYAKHPKTRGEKFAGKLFVFDDRIAVDVNFTDSASTISVCRHCEKPCDTYVNCANVDCNRLYFCCPDCEVATGRCCGEECQESERRRDKRGRLPLEKTYRYMKRTPKPTKAADPIESVASGE